MSSTKRRKLDAQPAAQQAAVSAISALAARRQMAAKPPPKQLSPSPEPEDEDSASARTNAFSVLQGLNSRTNNGPKVKSAKKSTQKSPHKPDLRSSLQKSSIQSEPSTSDTRVSYSSFVLTKNNCRTTSDGVIQLRLKDGERFLVLGSYGIRVITGQVTISGATLWPSDQIHWVHAAHCHAVPVLRTSERTSLELHNDGNSQDLRKLDCLSPLFQNIWNDVPVTGDGSQLGCAKTFQIICTSDDLSKKRIIQELSSPPEWNKKLASLASATSEGGPGVILICGPKSSGKSTFSKLLTNRLLTKEQAAQTTQKQKSLPGVVVLDLDPGQPEYAPSGTVSLIHVTQPNLGIPFTHPSLDDAAFKVIRCHALASISPASAPDHYLECAMDLLATHHRTFRHSHLLVNTPGWILGTGLDLLMEITSRMIPTEVVYMSEEGPAETVEGLRAATKKTWTTLPSQPSELISRTAIHLRAMSNMSYFHLACNDSSDPASRLRWNSSLLSTITPWQVRYSGPQSGILGIFSYDHQSPPDLLADSINGMIVAAVEIEDFEAFRRHPHSNVLETTTSADEMDVGANGDATRLLSLVSRTSDGLPYIPNPDGITLDPRYSRAIGLVLIRGIDTTTNTFQILTPIPPKRIREIKSQGRHIVLVHGKFDTPTWAYTEELYERSGQSQDIGADKDTEIVSDDTSDEEDEAIDLEDAATATSSTFPAQGSGGHTFSPWVEVLKSNEKRPIGSRVWRVRRDLGRGQGD